MDPPYTVSHNNNGFVKYNEKLFHDKDQQRLAQLVRDLRELGATYLLTNAAHASIADIFALVGTPPLETSRMSRVGGRGAPRAIQRVHLYQSGVPVTSFNIDDLVVPPGSLRGERTKRRSDYVAETVPHQMVDAYVDAGWEEVRRNKTSTRMRRKKRSDVAFEDSIWTLFADLGFTVLNRGRDFVMSYGEGAKSRKQLDVFAADDETVLLVECKAATGEPRQGSFKSDIEALGGIRPGLIKTSRTAFPNHKVKVIFATSRYLVSSSDAERMRNAELEHFDEETVDTTRNSPTSWRGCTLPTPGEALCWNQRYLGYRTLFLRSKAGWEAIATTPFRSNLSC